MGNNNKQRKKNRHQGGGPFGGNGSNRTSAASSSTSLTSLTDRMTRRPLALHTYNDNGALVYDDNEDDNDTAEGQEEDEAEDSEEPLRKANKKKSRRAKRPSPAYTRTFLVKAVSQMWHGALASMRLLLPWQLLLFVFGAVLAGIAVALIGKFLFLLLLDLLANVPLLSPLMGLVWRTATPADSYAVPTTAAAGWFSVCGEDHPLSPFVPPVFCPSVDYRGGEALTERQRQEIAKRHGIAVSAENGLKNMTDIVNWVVKTPASLRIQQIVGSASTMSNAFRHKTDLVSKDAIGRDLDTISAKADKLLDAVIAVETNGRVIAKDMIAGYDEILLMLEQPETYAAAVIEKRLNRQLASMESTMEELSEMLIAAQSVASETIAVQQSLVGKLFAEQNELEDQHYKYLDANKIMNKIWGAKPDLSAVQYKKLQSNLELCALTVHEMEDWHRHFSGYLLYLRTYRAQVRAGRRQLDEHIWKTGDLTLEDRIRSMSKLMDPAKQKLAEYEDARSDTFQPVHRPSLGDAPH